jgi:carbonic anhydrase
MSNTRKEVLAANQHYSASFGDKGKLAMPPTRHFAILTCMDARLDPAKFAGLSEGDAHVIRNAGGRASDDAIRSLVISYKLLGTREWFVIHHTNCGMEFFTNEKMRELLASSLETAELSEQGFKDVGKGPARAPPNTLNGSPFATRLKASETTSNASRTIRSYPRTSRSTGTSST